MREHFVEKKKEKQYIQSLIADLKDDNQNISLEIIAQEKRTGMMDSMIAILNDPSKIHGNESHLYYWGRVSPRLGTLPVNTRTFEQLKNSGNFRLIRKIEISNRIMAYYDKPPFNPVTGKYFSFVNLTSIKYSHHRYLILLYSETWKWKMVR